MRTVLYPGSFDPVTCGHLDIIQRAAAHFLQVVIGVLYNPAKPSGAFPIEERLALLSRVTEGMPGVRVQAFSGLLVDAAKACGAQAVIRGIRTSSDTEYELQMARLNRHLTGVETLLLAAAPEVAHVNAGMVREIGRYGGSLRGLVPDVVLEQVEMALREKATL